MVGKSPATVTGLSQTDQILLHENGHHRWRQKVNPAVKDRLLDALKWTESWG